MRKHDVRKWLHAILDLLPVILIPVFMIYSHRHTIDSGSIQVPQNEVVDFNQQVNFQPTRSYSFINSYTIEVSNNNDTFIPFTTILNNGEKYLYKCISSMTNFRTSSEGDLPYINATDLVLGYESIITGSGVDSAIAIINQQVTLDGNSILKFNLFNLSQMFGVGNEPTIEQFNQWYSNYYDYTLSHKELLKDVSTITYDDTDIMSQFTYQLYNSIDKYFNMGNVFHLNEVYDWFNLNIFNGQAPIYIFIVYQIVLYELIMDLLMLLYALFMWFIDMIEKLMEKPLNSIK